jgi:diguanylate cyclase (GGDEF)-like protein/PAS domain S-box-containing protein
MGLQYTDTITSSNRLRWLIIGIAFSIAAIVGVGAFILKQLHQNTLHDVQASLLRQSLVLSETVDRTFQSADMVLTSVTERIGNELLNGKNHNYLTSEDFHIFLGEKTSGLPQINAIGVIDADGKRINSSREWPNSPVDLSSRRYFQAIRKNPKLDFFVGEPMLGNISNVWVIVFAKPILAKNGNFLGVVFATTTLKYYEDLFRVTSLGEGYAATLMRDDGTLLARYPVVGRIGAIAKASVLTKMGNFASGTSRSISPIDHQARIAAAHRLEKYPLVVVATQSEEAAFAAWRTMVITMGLIGGVMICIITASAVLIFRSWTQQRRLNEARSEIIEAEKTRALAEADLKRQRELAAQMLLFDAAISNMAHALCMFDATQRLIVCNKQYAELYGLTKEQTKQGTTLREILNYRIEAGFVPTNHESYVEDRIKEIEENKPYHLINRLKDGRYISVVHRPMEGGGWVATHEDISTHKLGEQELDETKTFLDSIIANIPVAVVVKDVETHRFILTNRAFEETIGRSSSDLKGKTVFDIYRTEDAQLMDKADTDAIQNSVGISSIDYEVETPQLGSRFFSTKRIVIRDTQNDAKYLLVVIDDVTERKASEQRISFMAHHDALTGLANRLSVSQKIQEAAARQRRFGDSFGVLLLDLDRFKQVNDTLGHPAGDALLREVAARLKAVLRETDVLARLGGDEFAIIQASEGSQREAACSLASRIITIIGKPFEIDGNEVNIGTSIGIALAPEHGTKSDDLLKMADMALYRAKAAGRNSYRFFDSEMSTAANTRHQLENELRRAIQRDEFELHYQPIIDTKTNRVCGAETLVRWRHPKKGLIYPDQFIPLAEETGMIAQIGEWVLQTACVVASKWPDDVKVAVNLSPIQFRKVNLPDVVMCALAVSGLPPERLELEITETALIESAAECLPALRKFKNLGVSVALDDFGTGYSSLSLLTMFPFDKIKIDKSFTQNMTKRADCAAIISATLTLAQSLNIETTAEGVETEDQYRFLRLAGVTSLQGYLFKKPCSASEIDFYAIYDCPEIEDAA